MSVIKLLIDDVLVYQKEVGGTTPPPPTYTVNPIANPAVGGTVTGGGTFASGAVSVLKAVANPGYVFSNWTENGVVATTSPTFEITVLSNRSPVANFAVSGTPGGFTDLVNKAIKANVLETDWGNYSTQDKKYPGVAMPAGATKYFLIDPVGFGMTGGISRVGIEETDHTNPTKFFEVVFWLLDRNNNVIWTNPAPPPVTGGIFAIYLPKVTATRYQTEGLKLLFRVTERDGVTTSCVFEWH